MFYDFIIHTTRHFRNGPCLHSITQLKPMTIPKPVLHMAIRPRVFEQLLLALSRSLVRIKILQLLFPTVDTM